MLKTTQILLMLMFTVASQAMTLKHGVYLSQNLGVSADISGKHQDFALFNGTNPEVITAKNATSNDGKISSIQSVGYNLRYTPKVGFGYEAGLYFTKIKMPRQNAALKHSDGSPFIKQTATGAEAIVVDSPKSYMSTTDIYLGGLYNFAKIEGATPYLGLGYARIKGKWHNSYYSGMPGGAGYGESGKTNVDGYLISVKAGMSFSKYYNLELEHAKHKIHADAFRSFNINGSDAEINRNSINLIVNF